MTTDQSIIFYCAFCGQKVVIHQDAVGVTVACPTCNRGIHVPEPRPSTITGSASIKSETVLMEVQHAPDDRSPAPATPRRQPALFRILARMRSPRPRTSPTPTSIAGPASLNSDTALMEAEPMRVPLRVGRTTPRSAPQKKYHAKPNREAAAYDTPLIMLGCACLAAGLAGVVVDPHAFAKFMAFFLIAAVVGLYCLAERRAFWGVAMLLASSVLFLSYMPPDFPGSMRADGFSPRASQPGTSVAPVARVDSDDGRPAAPPPAIPQPVPKFRTLPVGDAQPAPLPQQTPLWFDAVDAPDEAFAPAETAPAKAPVPETPRPPTPARAQRPTAPAAAPAKAAALAEAFAQVNLADGVDQDEAVTIADAYFDVYVSGCGMANGATDKGSAWEVATYIDYNMRPHTPITVDKKSGRISSKGYPTVPPGAYR